MYCSHRGEIEIESHCATTTAFREYLWQSSPWTMDCSSGELNETESCRAIYNCTLRVSVTGPTTGLSNPCIDTQHLLCLVVYCSRGGEMEAESHRATYNCTLRVSATVLATVSVQSYDNGLLTWCIKMRQSLVVQFTTALWEFCDWPNYWSVQSLSWYPTSSVSCHVLLMWRRNDGGRVSSCNLGLHIESVCNSPCHGSCSILWQWIAHVVNWMRQWLPHFNWFKAVGWWWCN